ncbi:unnamed protein product [Clonostachys byssicola]|uniref:Uncharacterized protein n=1 Tax=Clonostachys byssicola TaxID=160290 RepID=A0A9N9ULI5_9HYPO|nr:unnamed protein product [Clonostachys byssicola]
MSESNETERQKCFRELQQTMQHLAELENKDGSSSQGGQQPGTDSINTSEILALGASLKENSTAAEFFEIAARIQSEIFKNGLVFHVPGTAEPDGGHSARSGPDTFSGCATNGNNKESEKAENTQGLATSVADTSRIQEPKASNQMSAEDVTSASDEKATNGATENEQK